MSCLILGQNLVLSSYILMFLESTCLCLSDVCGPTLDNFEFFSPLKSRQRFFSRKRWDRPDFPRYVQVDLISSCPGSVSLSQHSARGSPLLLSPAFSISGSVEEVITSSQTSREVKDEWTNWFCAKFTACGNSSDQQKYQKFILDQSWKFELKYMKCEKWVWPATLTWAESESSGLFFWTTEAEWKADTANPLYLLKTCKVFWATEGMIMQVPAMGNWYTNLPAGLILARPKLNASHFPADKIKLQSYKDVFRECHPLS